MSVKDEIHQILNQIQIKVNTNHELNDSELEMLFLAALIEEEAS